VTNILKWTELQNEFSEGLVIGNGASIAVSDGFRYESLYEAAKAGGQLREGTQAVFTSFKSSDFELVLRRLWQATLVNQALNIASEQVDLAYKEVRRSLIETVHAIHPPYADLQKHFPAIGTFLKGFHTVASLNYDLVLYWAAMWNNDNVLGLWFKDAFNRSGGKTYFRDDWETVRKPYGLVGGATLYFYPHGNLCLGTEAEGGEVKLDAAGENLLKSITEQWEGGAATPLFVSEGTSEQKLAAVRRSNYLSRVHIEVLGSLGEAVVFYGMRFGPQDHHVIGRVARTAKKVAISVYRGDEATIANASETFKKAGVENVRFFDAESAGAWIYT
jgi:hypothetical protein